MDDATWMGEALAEARRAAAAGEVPIGAVIVQVAGGARATDAAAAMAAIAERAEIPETPRMHEVVARAHNRREIDQDPLAHAELLAIREAAAKLGSWRLTGCTLYVTLEPCAMCAGALVNSRIERLVYGAADPKAGYCGTLGDVVRDSRLNHRLEVTAGVLEEECATLLSGFFRALRGKPAVL